MTEFVTINGIVYLTFGKKLPALLIFFTVIVRHSRYWLPSVWKSAKDIVFQPYFSFLEDMNMDFSWLPSRG